MALPVPNVQAPIAVTLLDPATGNQAGNSGTGIQVSTGQTQPNQVSLVQTWSSGGSAVAQNTVLLSIPDITAYTFFSLDNASGFNVKLQISIDGTNFRDVSMVDSTALTGDGTTATTLATGKLWTRGIKGVAARILAFDAASQTYAASSIQLAAGVGAP